MSPITHVPQRQPTLPGILPILRAAAVGQTNFDIAELDRSSTTLALRNGFGPLLAHISRDGHLGDYAEPVRAAVLTARLLTEELYEALERILRAAAIVACQPVLIKGAATALRYYPARHLRTMGDIDLYIPATQQAVLEAQLLQLGFQQSSSESPRFYDNHHHSMPFWHPAWRVWVEVHTRLFPAHSASMNEPIFALDRTPSSLQPIVVGDQPALAMNHELQLIYSCARWSEDLDPERGLYPILDVALLLQRQESTFDWDRICALPKGAPATTAVRLVLTYLAHWRISSIPHAVLIQLAKRDTRTNRLSLAILHKLVTTFIAQGRSYGRLLSAANSALTWKSLLQHQSPAKNLACVPCNILFPPSNPHRFSFAFALARLSSLLRRDGKRNYARERPRE